MKNNILYLCFFGLWASNTASAMMRTPFSEKNQWQATLSFGSLGLPSESTSKGPDEIHLIIDKIKNHLKPYSMAKDVLFMREFKKMLLKKCPEAQTKIRESFNHIWTFFEKLFQKEMVDPNELLKKKSDAEKEIDELHQYLKEVMIQRKKETESILISSPLPLLFVHHLERMLEEWEMDNLFPNSSAEKMLLSIPSVIPLFSRCYNEHIIPEIISIMNIFFRRNEIRKELISTRNAYTDPMLQDAAVGIMTREKTSHYKTKAIMRKKSLSHIKKKIKKMCSEEALQKYKKIKSGYSPDTWEKIIENERWDDDLQDVCPQLDLNNPWILYALSYLQVSVLNIKEATKKREDEIENIANQLMDLIPQEKDTIERFRDSILKVIHLAYDQQNAKKEIDFKKRYMTFPNQQFSDQLKGQETILQDRELDLQYTCFDIFNKINKYRRDIEKRIPKDVLAEYEQLGGYDGFQKKYTSFKPEEASSFGSLGLVPENPLESHTMDGMKNLNLSSEKLSKDLEKMDFIMNEIKKCINSDKKNNDLLFIEEFIETLLKMCPEAREKIQESFDQIWNLFLQNHPSPLFMKPYKEKTIDELHLHLKTTLIEKKKEMEGGIIKSALPLLFMNHLERILEQGSLDNLSPNSSIEKMILSIPSGKEIQPLSLRYYDRHMIQGVINVMSMLFSNDRVRQKLIRSRDQHRDPVLQDAEVEIMKNEIASDHMWREECTRMQFSRIKKTIKKMCSEEALQKYKERKDECFTDAWEKTIKDEKWNHDSQHAGPQLAIEDPWVLFALSYLQVSVLMIRKVKKEREDEVKNIADRLIKLMPDQKNTIERFRDHIVWVIHLAYDQQKTNRELKNSAHRSSSDNLKNEYRILQNREMDLKHTCWRIFDDISEYRRSIEKRVPQEVLDEYENCGGYDAFRKQYKSFHEH